MEPKQPLKPLPADLRSIVRSGISITSVEQCVEELVYNSIDAGAKTIRILINVSHFNVRVEDDGCGIREADLGNVGDRYTTSKCNSLNDLSNLRYYGFRGEALASIIDVSGTVDIITRSEGIELRKKFEEGRAVGCVEKSNTKNFKTETAVIIGRLLSKCPVRQQRIDKSVQQEEVRTCLERIALVNPGLNIELRNDEHQLFDFKASSSYSEAFDKLFKSRLGFEVKFIEEHYLFKSLFFKLSVSQKLYKSNNYQFVFVNNRVVSRSKIHKCVGSKFLNECVNEHNSSKEDKFPVFILNIVCAFSEYDLFLEPRKQKVEFRDYDDVRDGIEGLMLKLKQRPLGLAVGKVNPAAGPEMWKASFISSHTLQGAVHTRPIERPGNKLDGKGNSGRRSLGSSSGNSQDNKRNVVRTSHNTRVVDVREIRRKRKRENPIAATGMIQPAQMLYSINNKPRLTMGVFNKFNDWSDEFQQDNSDPPKKSKHIDNLQTSKTLVEASTSAAASHQQHESNISFEMPNSPSAVSMYQWKMNRVLPSSESCTEKDRNISVTSKIGTSNKPCEDVSFLPLGLNDDNSLDGFSDSGSAVVDNPNVLSDKVQKIKVKIMLSRETYMKKMVEETSKLPTTREYMLNKIISFWKSYVNKSKKKVLKSSRNKLSVQMNQPSTSYHINNKEKESDRIIPRLTGTSGNTSSIFSDSALVRLGCNSVLQDDTGLNINPGFMFKMPAPPPSVNRYPRPSLLSLLPCQKGYSTNWNDNMLADDYSNFNNDFSLDDWAVKIILDEKGQDWLQTEDKMGRNVYINLTNGKSSYDMINTVMSTQVSSEEMKRHNPARYTWLKRYFPKGFKKFVSHTEREIKKEGDISRIETSFIRESLSNCFDKSQLPSDKWKASEYERASKYFGDKTIQTALINDGRHVNMQCWNSKSGTASSFRFSRDDFEHVNVIGQLDKKFILAGIKKSMSDIMTLVIFDQHAVHERIRLECLISECFSHIKQGKKYVQSLELMPLYPINLSESEVRLMENHQDVFEQAGLKYRIASITCVNIKTAPSCYFDKSSAEGLGVVYREDSFQTLIRNLIQEITHYIMETGGANLIVLPKAIHEVLSSQACHRAIKFGDALDIDQCCKLVADLKKCRSLFQCAHGRPSVVPLLKPEDVYKSSLIDLEISRPYTLSEDHDSFLSHDQCSTYFCNSKMKGSLDVSSGYFTSTNDVSHTGLLACCDRAAETFNFTTSACKSNQDKSQVITIEDDEEFNDSPYFF